MEFLDNLPLAHVPTLAIISAALAINLLFCGERLMSRAFRSPQNYAGRVIDALDRRYNRDDLLPDVKQSEGRSVVAFLILVALLAGVTIEAFVGFADYAWIIEALLLSTILQTRLMLEQSATLSRALTNSTREGRATLCLISGLDTSQYTRSDVARMGTEVLTKSFTEGFVGILFYYWLFDLPGLLIFRMLNISSNMLSESQCNCEYFGAPSHRANALLMKPASYLAALFLFIPAFITRINYKDTIRRQVENYTLIKDSAIAHSLAMMSAILNIKIGTPPTGAGEINGDELHLGLARRLVLLGSYFVWMLWMVLFIFDIPSPSDWIYALFT